MRTVAGKTDHVVVIGAGLGGLSAALHLRGAGRSVTVLERADRPGGRAGRLELDGFRFDTGPTVLTMPHLIDDALAAVGERREEWLTLHRLDPAYRAHYADGSTLDVHCEPQRMAAEVERLCGPREAQGYLRFAAFTEALYRTSMRDFIDRNVDSPLDLVRLNLVRLVAMGGFRRMAPKVGQFFTDERLRRIFSFQALYVGLSPQQALALYLIVSYMDTVAGVYFPEGGMHSIGVAMAGAAAKHGVDVRLGTGAEHLELRGDQVVAVVTSTGERIPADAVVVNADLPAAYDLLPERLRPARPGRLRAAPSCVLLHLGTRGETSHHTAHHNLHFGTAWRQIFTELIDDGQLMSDPSLLVTQPTRTDPALAPDGGSTFYVLAPVPNLAVGRQDWSTLAPAYQERLLATLEERGYAGLGASVRTSRIITPLDWQRDGLVSGTPFSFAHSFGQTGPFRPPNLLPGVANLVLAGCGTVPGVGVPMVLISGRLAAQRITG